MKLRCLAWLLPLLCCCNKQGSNNVIKPPADFSFTTTYDSVYNCYPNSYVTLSFTINVLSGDITQNMVTYSVTSLPANITVFPATQTVGGVLGGAFTFVIGNVAPCIDTANFIISSAVYGTVKHKLILKVLPPLDYAPTLAGTYTHSYDFCLPDTTILYTSSVSTVVDTPYQIKISNVKNLGTDFIVRAWISKTVTIPVQTMNTYTIWGAGKFSHDVAPYDTLYQMIINDTLVQGVDTQYCTIHLQH